MPSSTSTRASSASRLPSRWSRCRSTTSRVKRLERRGGAWPALTPLVAHPPVAAVTALPGVAVGLIGQVLGTGGVLPDPGPAVLAHGGGAVIVEEGEQRPGTGGEAAGR